MNVTHRLVGEVGRDEVQKDSPRPKRLTLGQIATLPFRKFAHWVGETRGRRIGASIAAGSLAVGAILGIAGNNKYNEVFHPSKDGSEPAVNALMALQAKGVINKAVAKRVDTESGGGTYDPSTHTLTLVLRGEEDGQTCEAPFGIEEDFSALIYAPVYSNGEHVHDVTLESPEEVLGAMTRFTGSDGCQPAK